MLLLFPSRGFAHGSRKTIFIVFVLQIPVMNDRELTVDLLIYDSNGNLFDDASSLHVDWSTDDISAAEFLTKCSKSAPRKADRSTKSNGGVQGISNL